MWQLARGEQPMILHAGKMTIRMVWLKFKMKWRRGSCWISTIPFVLSFYPRAKLFGSLRVLLAHLALWWQCLCLNYCSMAKRSCLQEHHHVGTLFERRVYPINRYCSYYLDYMRGVIRGVIVPRFSTGIFLSVRLFDIVGLGCKVFFMLGANTGIDLGKRPKLWSHFLAITPDFQVCHFSGYSFIMFSTTGLWFCRSVWFSLVSKTMTAAFFPPPFFSRGTRCNENTHSVVLIAPQVVPFDDLLHPSNKNITFIDFITYLSQSMTTHSSHKFLILLILLILLLIIVITTTLFHPQNI